MPHAKDFISGSMNGRRRMNSRKSNETGIHMLFSVINL